MNRPSARSLRNVLPRARCVPSYRALAAVLLLQRLRSCRATVGSYLIVTTVYSGLPPPRDILLRVLRSLSEESGETELSHELR